MLTKYNKAQGKILRIQSGSQNDEPIKYWSYIMMYGLSLNFRESVKENINVGFQKA